MSKDESVDVSVEVEITREQVEKLIEYLRYNLKGAPNE